MCALSVYDEFASLVSTRFSLVLDYLRLLGHIWLYTCFFCRYVVYLAGFTDSDANTLIVDSPNIYDINSLIKLLGIWIQIEYYRLLDMLKKLL